MTIHIVQQGDSIWKIAQRYGVSAQRIISDNSIANPRELVTGQALLILIPNNVYTIQAGDTLSSVAARLGVSNLTLLQNNPNLILSPTLYPGQTLTVDFQQEKGREVTVNGYAYPFINRGVLLRALPYLTYLTIFGYGFTTQGTLIEIDDQPLINLAYQYRTAPVMLLSSITEDGNFSTERASLLFQDLALQSKVIDQIVAVMVRKGYAGLDVDFEYIDSKDAAAYLRFLENVTARLRPLGLFVNTDLAPKASSQQRGLLYESHNYASIGAISDTVLLMTYEWGYTYGPPLAVAPLNRVREVVEYAVTQISANKILLGIPNYGYDWLLPYERGITKATSIGNEYAIELAARYNSEIQYDTLAQSPYFEYWDSNGKKHIVWFEDVRSIQAKFDLMDEFTLLGCGYWNLMRPFAQNWGLLNVRYRIRKTV